MTQKDDTLGNTLEWFKRAVSEPTHRNQNVQLGVHLEEVVEMLEAMDATDPKTHAVLHSARLSLHRLAELLKTTPDVEMDYSKRKEILDGIADQFVTGVGFAHMLRMDPVGALNEVNRSNWSKFVNGQPLFDENLKIKKGPDYTRPDLEPFF